MAKHKPTIMPRKPPAGVVFHADEVGHAVTRSTRPPAESAPIPTPAAKRSRSVLTRKDGRELKRTTIYLPVALAKRVAIRCAEDDRELSDVITEALGQWLGRA